MKGKAVIISAVVASFLGTASAWGAEGHIVVARMAYDLLNSNDPSSLTAANKMLKTLTSAQPDLVEKEGDYPFVECAVMADDIREKGGRWQEGWHFVDNPYVDDGDISDYPQFQMEPFNVTTAIPGIYNWLKNDDHSSDAYTQIMNQVSSDDEGKSYALRLLIHYIGDIHQPLHCTSRVDSEFPAGDRGGNSFEITKEDQKNNLHAVWDAVLFEFRESMKLPFESDNWSQVGDLSSTLFGNYQITDAESNSEDFVNWGQESFQIGEDSVYAGIEEHERLPDSYVDKNKPKAERQLVLASHRLAHVISDIFGGDSEIFEEDSEVIYRELTPESFLQ